MENFPILLNKKTEYYNIQNNEIITNIKVSPKEKLSKELEEKLNFIEECIIEILTKFSNDNESELTLSWSTHNLIKKYIVFLYYRTLLHKTNFDSLKSILTLKNIDILKESLEKDLNLIANTDDIAEAKNLGGSDLLNYITTQVDTGYLTFWSAPTNYEFILTDSPVNYSKDNFSGGKLTHVIELKKTVKNKETEIEKIEKSLDYFPYNYMIIPVTSKLAMVLCSPFMALYTESFEDFKPPFSIFNLTYSGLKEKRFEIPKESNIGALKIKIFKKQELLPMEILYNNEIILNHAINFFSWTDKQSIKESLLYYNEKPNRTHDLIFTKEQF